MAQLDVRIVEMPPMRVACAHGFGANPEDQAARKMLAFLATKGLTFEDVQWYGFDNPCPSPGSPNYGYDVWTTVGSEIEAEGEITILEIPTRLYGVTRCMGVENITKVWQQLGLWFEESPYKRPAHWHQCLEHLLTHPDTPYEEYIFDLHVPLAP